jgi:molecular chaperone DnaK (HSP70)
MIAIDFGTTNSSVAVFADDDTEPRLQKLEYGDPESYDPNVIPSGVCSCRNTECGKRSSTYGHEALRHHFELEHDSTLLHEMKLDFDKSTQDPPSFIEIRQGTVLRDEGGFLTPVPATYRYSYYKDVVPLQPKQFVPGTARLVEELVRRSSITSADRREVAVGVPASFHELGKSRLREALKRGVFGESAGYEGVFLYPEPLAAARSYMRIERGNILVLDYGGGTLDITVMTVVRTDVFDPAKILYDGFPEAGSRMDDAILHNRLSRSEAAVQRWYESASLRTKLRVKRNVEKAKIALSTKPEAAIELPGSAFNPIRLTADDVSIALQPILTRMVAKVTETVVKHVGGIDAIDFVVLSGGTSLNRSVQDSVRALFQHIPSDRFVLPDADKPESVEICFCAVARGLALLHRDGFAPLALPPPRMTSFS